MRAPRLAGLALILAAALSGGPAAWSQAIPHFPARGWFDFKAPVMRDPALQHAKETFIQYGCAYCHNVDLHPRGEAADLMHSPIVASDTDGSVIAQVLKAGIPQTAKLSPMPQFSDLSERELADIARWIHYARMEGRFEELMQPADTAKAGRRPDAGAGRAYFAEACAACHSAPALKRELAALPAKDRRAVMLKPSIVEAVLAADAAPAAQSLREGQARHRALLETYEDGDVADLLSFLSVR